MASVIVKQLSKGYGKVEALKNVSFSVETGELFGFIGPDGAGKTTLLRILTTVLSPDSGQASVEGFEVSEYKKIRQIVGYMPGRFSLYQDLTVEENLRFFATVFGTTVEQNYELIKSIYRHIEPFKKRLAGQLSGGMKQKLALCCALIHRPRVLFLDEPTTGVDAVSRREFWEMLTELKKKNITILVSTPYMDEAALCDRVALMQEGLILSIDTPQAIVNAYSKTLFAISGGKEYRVIKLLQQYPYTESVYPFGDSVHYIDKRPDVHAQEIGNYLHQQGLSEAQVLKAIPDIEDCFIDLMKKVNKPGQPNSYANGN
ncbi:MAG: hypothetical protein KatS3mg031_1020 [Chitinophagales bacterium]|nr:MAG: hypothetical protein KatS3mg031_1020 [Chitinophagales bacterium]